MLINFLLDYSQDSSKVDKQIHPLPQSSYFNSNFSLIETVSIIFNDLCLSYSSSSRWFDLKINEISMLVNMDDQSLSDDLETDSLTRRKFFVARQIRLGIERFGSRLRAERQLVGTRLECNKIIEVAFESISVNYLFKYDFAKLLDHFLNLRKCLMLMHGITRLVSQSTAEISYDFWMSVKQLRLSVEDDPFEVIITNTDYWHGIN